MERGEALAILGIEEPASREQIDAAYHAAIKVVHPDVGGAADPERARQLNEARVVALHGSTSMAVVPVHAVLDLVRAASSSAVMANRMEASERTVLIEPVFGNTKFNRRIDRFQRRGLAACRSEWRLIAATHNLTKLHRHHLAAQAT